MTPINPQSVSARLVGGSPITGSPLAIGGQQKTEEGSFQNLLVDSLKQVNSMQAEAAEAQRQWAAGGEVNPAQVLTAVQKASQAFDLTVQVRNKLMDVYREIQEIRI